MTYQPKVYRKQGGDEQVVKSGGKITLEDGGAIEGGGDVLLDEATGQLGFKAGAGGAVTQATNASTGVTLSKPTGQITTVALTTAAAAEERFTVTNTLVAATDVVVATISTYAGAGTPVVSVIDVTAGSFDIVVANLHASAALDAALTINFVVLKGAAA